MSVGSKLDKMENIEENVVTKGAKPADPMQKMSGASVEDLGGPTPENYKPDDDSAKLKTPGGTLKQVKDIVTKGAKPAEGAKGMKEEETEVEGEVVAENEQTTEDVVSEEETTTDEVVTEEETTEEYNVEEDVNALLGGEELSEEFREKAKVIFEAALNSKTKEIQEALEVQYSEKLAEEKEGLKDTLTERVDAYLEYVCEEWMKENELAVEAGLKTEMTESFLEGMKGLFEEHYVTIPEDKYDVLESMVEKLDEMETKLNEQIDKNIDLNKRLAESTADSILDQISEGLAVTQKEKLASLAESVEFESETEYREKLETLKESYFSKSSPAPKVAQQQTLSEGVDTTEAPVSGSMDAYLRSLGAFKK